MISIQRFQHEALMELELVRRHEWFARQEEVAWTENLLLTGTDEVIRGIAE